MLRHFPATSSARSDVPPVSALPETLWCSAKHYAIRQREEPTGAVDETVFEELLDGYDESEVFVHAGLSDVNAAFEGDPYQFLVDALTDRFDSVLTPAFTSSFRDTGYFNRADTEPELGAFASLFFEDADHRTADPIHSVQVLGDYRFDGCDVRDTFAPEGCYGQLEDDDVRILNVGTRWLVSTQLHYVERVTDVPYAETATFEGTVGYADGTHERVTQRNYDRNNYVFFWNRLKIVRDLLEAGVLDSHDLNGLTVISVTARDLRDALESRIEEDPYYMVR